VPLDLRELNLKRQSLTWSNLWPPLWVEAAAAVLTTPTESDLGGGGGGGGGDTTLSYTTSDGIQ
jgi:hypothetical protein